MVLPDLTSVFFYYQNLNEYFTPTKPISSHSFSQNSIKLAKKTDFKYTEGLYLAEYVIFDVSPIFNPVGKERVQILPLFHGFRTFSQQLSIQTT